MTCAKNVFINCPFDKQYKELLNSLLFCIIYLDFNPNISCTQSSAKIRINEIKKRIVNSKFGIHDLSRCRPTNKEPHPRFNMPFELGLDMGCIEYGVQKHRNKKLLILEADQYYYDRIISDISGQDISSHKDSPKELIYAVRNFFNNNIRKNARPASVIWYDYIQFQTFLKKQLKTAKYTKQEIDDLASGEYIKYCKEWRSKAK